MLEQQQYEKFLSYCYFNHIPPTVFEEGYLGWNEGEGHHFRENSIISNHLREWLQMQQDQQCEVDFSTANLVQFSTRKLYNIYASKLYKIYFKGIEQTFDKALAYSKGNLHYYYASEPATRLMALLDKLVNEGEC